MIYGDGFKIVYRIENRRVEAQLRQAVATESMDLAEHFKALKAIKPVKSQKKDEHAEGLFRNLTFCFPLTDPTNDPSKEKLKGLVQGIRRQHGQCFDLQQKTSHTFAKFLVISEKTDVQQVVRSIGDRIRYEEIIRYGFIEDSLKYFRRMDLKDYILYENKKETELKKQNIEHSKSLLAAETISDKLKRPKLGQGQIQGIYLKHLQIKEMEIEKVNEPERIEEISKIESTEDTELDFEDPKLQFDDDQIVAEIPIQGEAPKGQNEKESDESDETLRMEEELIDQIKPQRGQSDLMEEPVQQKQCKARRYFRKEVVQQAKPQKIQQPKKQYEPLQINNQNPNHYHPRLVYSRSNHYRKDKYVWFDPPKNLASYAFPKNLYICSKLQEVKDIYEFLGFKKQFEYLRVIACIKCHPEEIRCADDLEKVYGIVSSIKYKIKELLHTGKIDFVLRFRKRNELATAKVLTSVSGIGLKKAQELIKDGIRSIEDLKKHPEILSRNMSIGLKYYDQFAQRIPRDKVTRIFQYVKDVFVKQVFSDKNHHLVVVGSYRRKKATCGDIDILICRHDGSVETDLLRKLVRELQERKFITESLSQPRPFTAQRYSSYMGVCFFEGQHHRIDIKHYPVSEYAFALMYFTGSDVFNRQVRTAALTKGLKLSDKGFETVERNGKHRIWKGGAIPMMKSEEDIFKFLDLCYCAPQRRQL